MRTFLPVLTALASVATATACEQGPGVAKEPPTLSVTSPARSSSMTQSGLITVTGKVTPNLHGDAIAQVLVNNVQATLATDGSFSVQLALSDGVTMIETVAKDVAGGTARDTRAVQSGQLMPVGSDIERAVGAAISRDSFAKISTVAGPIIKGIDINALIKPMQPMVNVGTAAICAYVKLFVDTIKYSDIKVNVVPVAGGVTFDAEIDGLDTTSHVDYAIPLPSCTTSTAKVITTATKVTAAGTLGITAAGPSGFNVSVINPKIVITGMNVQSDALPASVQNDANIQQVIQTITAKIAEFAIGPVFNKVAGTLTGPQQLNVLGLKVTVQVVPVSTAFAATGGVVGLNMKLLIEGGEKSPGFIYTTNRMPSLDTSQGLQIGVADDLINEVLAEIHAIGLLNLSLPQDAGVFDTAQVKLSMPPTVSADGRDGTLRLLLGDMVATFTSHGTPVARAAINVRVNLKIGASDTGIGLGIQLAEPEIRVNTLADIPNVTGLSDEDLATAVSAVLGSQLDSIGKLLGAIPMPANVAGLSFGTTAMGSNDGYVIVSTSLK